MQNDDPFARTAVIGTGMMGPGIAVALAQGGCDVALVGRSQASVARGLAGVAAALTFLVERDLLDPAQALVLRERIRGTTDLEGAVADAGLVQESIVEDLEQKRALFAWLVDLCAPHALLTSDTSGLRISAIAEGLPAAARMATLHFWNPPHLMPLVEITKGEQTAEATVQALIALMRRCGKVPVVARKDVPGQIANRLQHALLREAIYMVQEGIASAEDIDLGLKMGPGRRWPVYGVLEHQDMVGLDLSLSVQSAIVPALCRADTALPLLAQKVTQGELGVKSGQGFYDWGTRDADEVRRRRDDFLCMLARDWPAAD
ncbi:MAG TPA: 3-hydroxyacyl-CoA dehydrogenase family protein [Chloroflexota bacterium]|jgi:3-hydroxybutyryl-CoA dehydrogenase|nr:3-hydroxyacyl-CoA dehydrogenase family protein [Chloroflexota bacterium]